MRSVQDKIRLKDAKERHIQERAELDKKLIENDKKYEEKLREKYNPDDIFKKRDKTSTNVQETNLPMKIKKESFLKRLINYIKEILIRK